jgi:L-2-hydroxyglutarate oxidase
MTGQPVTDAVVVGGGIVGLAVAWSLLEARPGASVVVLEKELGVARHQTGRNSGVIHSGIYYAPGSLKARLCRDGYERLLDFCRAEGIPHRVTGKVIVATSADEVPGLERLRSRAEANGLPGVGTLGPEGIRAHEPHCTGLAALHVPQTGIVDYAAVSRRLAERIVAAGGEVRLGTEVRAVDDGPDGATVRTSTGSIAARRVVACAGLQSDRIARTTLGDLDLRILPFRGEYFELVPDARGLVQGLIYPVPDPAFPFLGVHFTRMVGGGVECGPNAVLALAREGYGKWSVHPRDVASSLAWPGLWRIAARHWRPGLGEVVRSASRRAFTRALRRLVPDVESRHLVPAPSGIRAQACGRDGRLLDDFEIRGRGAVVHVCNAPSPAATASLAIGAHVVRSLPGW